MSQPPRLSTNARLAVLLALFIGLGVWYSLTIPLGEAPDELPHFTYVRYLVQHGRLPTTEEEHEAFQPPLYYGLGAALTFWVEDDPAYPFVVQANAHFDADDARTPKNLLLHSSAEAWPYRGWALAWHLGRLVSIALGAVTVWSVYQLGRTLFPGGRGPGIALAMAALTAFIPQFLFMSSVVNNDNAATAFSALVLWQVARLLRDSDRACAGRLGARAAAEPTRAGSTPAPVALVAALSAGGRSSRRIGRSLVLGCLLGLGLLTKASLLALVPVVGLAIVVAEIRCDGWRKGVGRAILSGAVILGAIAFIAGWYFYRNWRLYGDPLGWSFLLQINAQRDGPLTPGILAWLFKGVFRSFWLGWIGIAFDETIYWLIGAACAVGLVGFAAWLLRGWRRWTGGRRWTLALLGLYAALTIASLIRWTATVLGTDQGRLIYPILPVVVLILVAGWAAWLPWPVFDRRRAGEGLRSRAHPLLLGGLVAGMLSLAIITPIAYIAPVHAPAPMATAAELAAAQPLIVDWHGVRLVGYRLESLEAKPGGELVLHLYWQATEPVSRNVLALIQLVDAKGQFLMYVDGSPTAGRDTTDRWPVGVSLASEHVLPVPDYAQPGAYHLTISLHPANDQSWLPATGPDDSPLGDRLILPETIRLVDR